MAFGKDIARGSIPIFWFKMGMGRLQQSIGGKTPSGLKNFSQIRSIIFQIFLMKVNFLPGKSLLIIDTLKLGKTTIMRVVQCP